ncbi:alpha-1,6-mannosylglycoprotein 6-beta-N-acetylglucosaminyltransferase B-like isoform X1 [Petromyzon marinus]|uniref:alpha-1,6-mannosylglycoprotein 6-beta-N-acetylglucosaminyltransferase B-like isoform X1 n=1 Tax=Petromyzon marinus TaxID=7757 RepID=UPI003F71721E
MQVVRVCGFPRRQRGVLLLCMALALLMAVNLLHWCASTKRPEALSNSFPETEPLALRLRGLTETLEELDMKLQSVGGLNSALAFLLQLNATLHSVESGGVVREIRALAGNVSRIRDALEKLSGDLAPPRRRSANNGNDCDVPKDPDFPLCQHKVEYLQRVWAQDPCYAFYGVDGSVCSALDYLGTVEHFCPPLIRAPSATGATTTTTPAGAAAAELRSDVEPLAAAMVAAHSHLPAVTFMASRLRRMRRMWKSAASNATIAAPSTPRAQKKILVHLGLLVEGDGGGLFGEQVTRGGPLGELVQWADALGALYTLGHSISLSMSLTDLKRLVAVPPGKGSCPITTPLPFDLVYTDYLGLAQMSRNMGLSFRAYACRYRVVDSFGTEPAYNHAAYAERIGLKSAWGSWGLQPQQYLTMFPHTPDNSFLGFVSAIPEEEEAAETPKDARMALVYGKAESMWQGKEPYLRVIAEQMDLHATVYQPPGAISTLPAFVTNHGLLAQPQLQALLQRAKLFVGLGFPYEGPAPLEAIASGCAVLLPRFSPPHSSNHTAFFQGKPTARLLTSQHPYVETLVGRPHVWTVDASDPAEVARAVRAIAHSSVTPHVPLEFTAEGTLQRVDAYLRHQDFCAPGALRAWPPHSALRAVTTPSRGEDGEDSAEAAVAVSCVDACAARGWVCEPAFFQLLNSPGALNRLGIRCDALEEGESHLYPAFLRSQHRCFLQKEPLLFSCAGAAWGRVCPCRDFLKGQLALCHDCL